MTMTDTPPRAGAGLLARFAAFVAERHPFALRPAVGALDMAIESRAMVDPRGQSAIESLREPLRRLLPQTLSDSLSPEATAASKHGGGVPDPLPGDSVDERRS
ncbi:MAG: hypothetical protein JWN02_1345, partial [Acidobacteria bacterium]|nr:hypothetical protein [Acidobacteriota bacterium]